MEAGRPTINELYPMDDDPEPIDVVSEKLIRETKQRKSVLACFVPVEEEVIEQEKLDKRVGHIPSLVKNEPIVTEGFVTRKEDDQFCVFCETRKVIYEVAMNA